MTVFDKDLYSVQEARILAEAAAEAKTALAEFTQDQLDEIVSGMMDAVIPHIPVLARQACEETGYGIAAHKMIKDRFVCESLKAALDGMQCVGIISEDAASHTMQIGVPVGVIAGFSPATSPVATTIFEAVIALKAGNTIVFSPHPRAEKVMARTLDLMIAGALEKGMPKGALSYLHTVAEEGAITLMQHPQVNLILNAGVPALLQAAKATGKPLIYGGGGNGPAFIERTADIRQAVRDIMDSKTFDNGMVSAAEQAIVVESCIEPQVRDALRIAGAYFMSEAEADRLGQMITRPDGGTRAEFVGVSAKVLAERAGFDPGEGVRLLIAQGSYAMSVRPFDKDKLCPVISYYIEDDWQNACQKCIELLFMKGGGHTLVIHSKDDYVIRQFALKKPVARLLVNTPATLGGMGMTTDLFPSMVLGSGITGQGITSENVSPMNLIYIRTVGWGTRGGQKAMAAYAGQEEKAASEKTAYGFTSEELMQRVMARVLEELDKR